MARKRRNILMYEYLRKYLPDNFQIVRNRANNASHVVKEDGIAHNDLPLRRRKPPVPTIRLNAGGSIEGARHDPQYRYH
jgi:hypothetical protein